MPASATATGTVTSLSPLTISIGNDVTISLKLAANMKVSKVVPFAFSKVKVGDRLIATGQAGSDGMFVATTVGINMEIAGLGPAEMGPRGFAGAGKPGGPKRADAPTAPDAAGTDSPPAAETDRETDPNGAVALQLMQANCGCHNGGGRGPDLSHEGSQRNAVWIAAYIANPKSKNPGSKMPAMAGRVSKPDIAKIASFLGKAK